MIQVKIFYIKYIFIEYFSHEEEKPIELSNEEKIIYGNREAKNYKKSKLLGK
jgi:hypothetical protein